MDYKLIRSRRKTLSLIVRDGELIVRAPVFANIKFIEDFINTKRSWIDSKINISIERYNNFKFGSKVIVFGELLTLERGCNLTTVFDKSSIKIPYQGTNEKVIKIILEKFYKQEAKRFVKEVIDTYPEFTVKDILVGKYRSKWGSCTHDDSLAFSLKIAMLPESIGKYIVIHELCHIQQKNHSKKFWDLVYNYDKDYNQHRRYLRVNSMKFNI